MKNLRNATCIIATISTSLIFSSQSKIIIRPATLNDLDAITQLSTDDYTSRFKKLWLNSYNNIVPLEQDIDTFINEKIENQKKANLYSIQQEAQNECVLLIAEVTTNNKEKQLAGYCRFTKENAYTLYINYILVDKSLRKQGIGKLLAQQSTSHFTGITECKFRSLAHDHTINMIYQKHGCTQTGTIALDHNTGLVRTDSCAPITHIEYSASLQK
jgi:L-lactate utilization protein LutC